MSLYKMYEETIREIFHDSDEILASLIRECFKDVRNEGDIYSALSYISGYLDNKFPATAGALFSIVSHFRDKKERRK